MDDNNKDFETNKTQEEQSLHDQFFSSQKNMEEDDNNGNRKIWILVALFVLIAAGLAWYLNGLKSDLSTEKTEILTPETGDNDSAEKQITTDSINNKSEVMGDEQADQVVKDTSDIAVEPTEGTSATNATEISADDLHYFIISGAFSSEENAQKKVTQLSNDGHKAIIVGKNKAGLFMVAYDGYQDMQSAKDALIEIRNTQKSAWIYKK